MQNNLQMIFKTLNLSNNNLYNIANNKTKNMTDTYIEELKEKGILKGYFGTLAKNIYSRTRVKNSEILELFIYGAYIEEQSKLDKYEKQIMYDDINYYYNEGQKEVIDTLKNKKPLSIIDMALFLYLLEQPNYTGMNFTQCIQATIQYNAQQLYRQALINIQQQKDLEIENNEFQKILKGQQNTKLCINNDKISGFMDMQLIGMNNLAKLEGIKKEDNNAKVRFTAVIDGRETDMCNSLDGQEFYINKENVFDRYYGETQKDLRIERIRCKGLVLGLNLPPISHHFHFCRSYIIYVSTVEKQEKNKYNDLEIPKINKEVSQLLKNTKLNNKVRKLFNKYLIDDNIIIDNTDTKFMYYDIDKDKIIINNKHIDSLNYDLAESLTHEIIHLIDIRNKISEKIDITSELRRAEFNILNDDKYLEMFKQEKYANNMTLSDIFSAVTNNKVVGNIGHYSKYWNEDITRVKKEISANIMSAYLNNNKDTLKVINSIKSLKEIKNKVVKNYNDYT